MVYPDCVNDEFLEKFEVYKKKKLKRLRSKASSYRSVTRQGTIVIADFNRMKRNENQDEVLNDCLEEWKFFCGGIHYGIVVDAFFYMKKGWKHLMLKIYYGNKVIKLVSINLRATTKMKTELIHVLGDDFDASDVIGYFVEFEIKQRLSENDIVYNDIVDLRFIDEAEEAFIIHSFVEIHEKDKERLLKKQEQANKNDNEFTLDANIANN